MNFGERLVKARESLGFSQADFADKIALAAQSLARYEKNKVKPSVDFLTKLTDMFNLNSNWLLTGKGSIGINNSENLPVAIPKYEDDENTVSINYYPDIVAAAGYGGINEYEFRKQTMRLDRAFLEQFLNVRRFDRLDIITVFGDSMEPFVSNGETVILERIDDARNGETVIANINGDMYVKRIKKDPLNRWVKFLSDNNGYDEIELSGEDLLSVTIVGIVRAKIRPF